MKTHNHLYSVKSIISAIAAIAIIAGVYVYLNGGNDIGKYDTVIASRGELTKEVNVTGKVKPVQSVSLAFENGGRVAEVFADVGDNVVSGQALVRLESGGEYAKVDQAKADLEAEEIALQELLRGARPEDIAVLETKADNARQSIREAEKDLRNKIQESFAKADNAVRNEADQLFSNPRSTSPALNIFVSDDRLKNDILSRRIALESTLKIWESLSYADLNEGSINTQKRLLEVKTFLDKMALAVNSLEAFSGMPQTTIDGYKSDISSARDSIAAAITGINAAEEKLTTAQSALALTERELELKKAPATAEDMAAQKARIKSKRALLDMYNVALAKTVLRAPFDGIVTKQDAKKGIIVTAGTSITSMISESEFEIEAFIPEADIANVSVGDIAAFTLDAYKDDVVFGAKVFSIDPAETVIDGVPTYKTILRMTNKDERVKSGMTADIDILIGRLNDVIAIPLRAVYTVNGEKFARVFKNGVVEERKISTGLRGSDGRVEVTGGIAEGEEVIVFEKK